MGCRILEMTCSIADRSETDPAQRPSAPTPAGQDLASSHSPGSLPSWTWGRGGSERGWRVSRPTPRLALFINTTRYCMCPPFINRLFTPKDKTAPPDLLRALGGPSLLWGRHFAPGPQRIPSPTAPGRRALWGWGHGSRGLGAAGPPPPRTVGQDPLLFAATWSLPRNGDAIIVIVEPGPGEGLLAASSG